LTLPPNGIYATVLPSAEAGVRKDRLHLPRFFLELKYSLYFVHDLLFALSRVVCFTNFYFCRDAFFKSTLKNSSLHSFAMSVPFWGDRRMAFKMGGEKLLLCHDIYDFTAMPSFVTPRYL
jgi:hypothetical protein